MNEFKVCHGGRIRTYACNDRIVVLCQLRYPVVSRKFLDPGIPLLFDKDALTGYRMGSPAGRQRNWTVCGNISVGPSVPEPLEVISPPHDSHDNPVVQCAVFSLRI